LHAAEFSATVAAADYDYLTFPHLVVTVAVHEAINFLCYIYFF